MERAIPVLIALTVLFLSLAVGYWQKSKGRPIDRLRYYDDYIIRPEYARPKKLDFSPRGILNRVIPILTYRIEFKGKSTEEINRELRLADMRINAEELFIIKLLSASFAAFFALIIFGDLIASLIFFIIVWLIPRMVVRSKINKRLKKFDEQLNSGIIVIANALRAGHSFMQALSLVADETADPFSKEFKRLMKEINFGVPVSSALKDMAVRMRSDDFKLFVNAVLIQMRLGGNLAEILDGISETIRERQKIRNEIRTLTAQGRISGTVVSGIPLFLGLFLYLITPEQIMRLFSHPLGIAMIGIALTGQIIGYLIIRKIVDIDVL